METINSVFIKFLSDQDDRLKKRTFNKYKDVIELFEHHLNNYGYNYLNEEDSKLFDRLFNEEDKDYCEIFEVDKIFISDIEDFLDYFMIRKVMASKTLMKKTGTVMRKLIKWLKENDYINQEKYKFWLSTVNDIKDDLPKVSELSSLIYDLSQRNQYSDFTDYKSGYFKIIKIDSNKLWLKDFLESGREFGPVEVTKEISSLAKEDWDAYLELGKIKDKWLIIGSGNVYP